MQEPITLAVVGATEQCCALLKVLKKINSIHIAMVAGRPDEPAFQVARKLGIPTTTNPSKILAVAPLDVIVDMYGNPEIIKPLAASKDDATVILSGGALRLLMFFIQEKEELTDIRRIVEKIYDRLGDISTTTTNLYHLPEAVKEDQPLDIISLDKMEQLLLRQALHKYGSTVEVKKRAAQALKISLATLYNKLKKYQII